MKNRIWISVLLIVAILSSAFAWAEESYVFSEVVEPVMEEAVDFELSSDIAPDEGELAEAQEAEVVQKGSSENSFVSKEADDANHVRSCAEIIYTECEG